LSLSLLLDWLDVYDFFVVVFIKPLGCHTPVKSFKNKPSDPGEDAGKK